jgi:hypothetical protein
VYDLVQLQSFYHHEENVSDPKDEEAILSLHVSPSYS